MCAWEQIVYCWGERGLIHKGLGLFMNLGISHLILDSYSLSVKKAPAKKWALLWGFWHPLDLSQFLSVLHKSHLSLWFILCWLSLLFNSLLLQGLPCLVCSSLLCSSVIDTGYIWEGSSWTGRIYILGCFMWKSPNLLYTCIH